MRRKARLLLPAIAVLAALLLALYPAAASAHEQEGPTGWNVEPVVNRFVDPVRIDRAQRPTERFVSLQDLRIDEMEVATVPTPMTPDGQHLWVRSGADAATASTSCVSGAPDVLATVNLEGGGGRVVLPGAQYQPSSVGDLHRGPLGRAFLTDSCGRPRGFATPTPSGDLVDLQTFSLGTEDTVRALRWVHFDSGVCCFEWTTPGIVLQLDGPDGPSTAMIETATGTVRSHEQSAADATLWRLTVGERFILHRDGESRLILLQSSRSQDHDVVALWPSPIRGVVTAGNRHAMFSDDGLMLIDTMFPFDDVVGDSFTKEVLTRDAVTDVAWTPADDSLVWTGPGGTWLRDSTGDTVQLSDTAATSVDVSADGSTIVAVEEDGYRVFEWQREIAPEDPNTIGPFTPLTAQGLGPLRLGSSLEALPDSLISSLSAVVADPTNIGGCGQYQLTSEAGQIIATGFFEDTADGPLVRSIITSGRPNAWGVAYGASHRSVIEQFGSDLVVVYRKFSYDMRLLLELPDAEVLFMSDQQTIHEVRVAAAGWATVDYCSGP